MQKFTFIIYDLILALWIGGMFMFTFIVTPVIFKSYGRDMAGEIVGRLFPGYFLFSLVISVLALIGFFLVQSGFSKLLYRGSLLLIIAAVAVNLYITFKLYPEIKKVKKEIVSFENTPPDSPSRKQFGRLHAISAILNLLLLADGTTLLILKYYLKA